MRNSRPVDPAKTLDHLERKHAKLKEQVAEFDCRSYLTAEEQVEMQRLKKEKLATKDELETVKRRAESA